MKLLSNRPFLWSAACLTLALGASVAHAAPTFQQGFEVDTDGWFDGGIYGSITRVASGTGGITSADGSHHAIVTGTSGQSAPFTRFGGYNSTWPGNFTTSLDVYLSTDWAVGTGFSYSSAISNSGGDHRRDFIFHIAVNATGLMVGASNNANGAPQVLPNSVLVDTSGWYTLQHVFRDAGGLLEVDLNLLDADGDVVFTNTRSDITDIIGTTVGGNRYGWFTFINIDGGVAIDNTGMGPLGTAVPTPGTLALAGLALLGLAASRRRS